MRQPDMRDLKLIQDHYGPESGALWVTLQVEKTATSITP
jgi:hypothetical protein